MIEGIPYFGEDNQSIWENILNSYIKKSLNEESLYDLIDKRINKRCVVVIDNKWLSWLNDITFNYRDKECYIPYYTFELFEIDEHNLKTDNKGHLLFDGDTVRIRYNYKLEKYNININKLSLVIYDLDTDEKYKVSTNKWIDELYFDINKLYNLYLDSCYVDDDFLITKHTGGYHFITKVVDGFFNKECYLRKENRLQHYSTGSVIICEYRDVRQYKNHEVVKKEGFRETSDTYKIRRLKFESYLYCILREKLSPNKKHKKFLADWDKLGKSSEYIKYGNNIKLIIKSYWLNSYQSIKYKSWTRINREEATRIEVNT